jgi:hypothetical protein
MRTSTLLAAGLVLAIGVPPANALHKDSPPAIRVTAGVPVAHPGTRSWGNYLAFSSTDDVTNEGATGRTVYVFNLFNYDCENGATPLIACPPPGTPAITRESFGPGDPDNPTIDSNGAHVAFDADGTYDGGTGGVAAHRQIYLRNLGGGPLTRLTSGTDGDSVRPSIDHYGRRLVFESTASLLGPGGTSQIFVYDLVAGTLTRLTSGAAPSTSPMLNRYGKLVAFESRADLLGSGADTGIEQIFWYDLKLGELHQLTNGNAPSRHPYVVSRVSSRPLRARGVRRPAILFDSAATDLPGTTGATGTQVYAGSARYGDLPSLVRLTPFAAPGCTPPAAGDARFPASDPTGRHISFASTADLLCNATTGYRLFMLDVGREPLTLYQITGKGDVVGPVSGHLGFWFVSFATTDDLTGTGVCGSQLHVVDYFIDRWPAATAAGTAPIEPPAASPDLGCDDADPCTTDTCGVGDVCQHADVCP